MQHDVPLIKPVQVLVCRFLTHYLSETTMKLFYMTQNRAFESPVSGFHPVNVWFYLMSGKPELHK